MIKKKRVNNYQDITRFQLLDDKVLVSGIEVEEIAGILKPSSYEHKPELGLVITVGEGRMLESGQRVPMRLKKGDVVLFNKYSSEEYNLDGQFYYIVRAEDIVGYLRK